MLSSFGLSVVNPDVVTVFDDIILILIVLYVIHIQPQRTCVGVAVFKNALAAEILPPYVKEIPESDIICHGFVYKTIVIICNNFIHFAVGNADASRYCLQLIIGNNSYPSNPPALRLAGCRYCRRQSNREAAYKKYEDNTDGH